MIGVPAGSPSLKGAALGLILGNGFRSGFPFFRYFFDPPKKRSRATTLPSTITTGTPKSRILENGRPEKGHFFSFFGFGPRWPPRGPKRGPKWTPKARKWAQMAPHGPRWPQNGPRWPQDGPKIGQDGPKMAPKVGQDGPRWPKNRKETKRKPNEEEDEGEEEDEEENEEEEKTRTSVRRRAVADTS